MDVRYANAFVEAFLSVVPQFGLTDVQKKGISVKGKLINSLGVMTIVGVVGDIKGNVVYSFDEEGAKKIASSMMMGMPVNELDDMSKSALTELANMLTANAATNLSKIDVTANISTPTLMCGKDLQATMSTDKVLCIAFSVDGVTVETNIALDNI